MPSLIQLAASACVLFATISAAHPGHDIQAEIEERGAFIRSTTNLQAKCGETLRKRGIQQRAVARRQALAESWRKSAGIQEGVTRSASLNQTLADSTSFRTVLE